MKSIIFDLYGTLIDLWTNENRNNFWQRLAIKTRKYHKYEYKELRKKYLNLCEEYSKKYEEIELLDVFNDLYGKDNAKEVAIIFRKLSTKYIRLYKGVDKLFKYLKENKYKIYLLSNAQSCFTNYELKKLGIYDKFDKLYLSSDYSIKKPNINFISTLIKNEKLDIENTIMVGNDYICDIAPAMSLNIKTIYLETNQSRFVDNVEKIKGFNLKEIIRAIEK